VIETAIDYKTLFEQSVEQNKGNELKIISLQHELANLKRLIFGSLFQKHLRRWQH